MCANLAHIFSSSPPWNVSQLGSHFYYRLGPIIRAILAHISNFGSSWSEVPCKNWAHHGPSFHFCPTWAEVPDLQKWCPIWPQLTSGQVDQKLAINDPSKKVTNLVTFLLQDKLSWSWSSFNFIPTWDEVALFNLCSSWSQVNSVKLNRIILSASIKMVINLNTILYLCPTWPQVTRSASVKSLAKLARLFNFVPTWDEVNV